MQSIKKKWWYRLLPTILSVALLLAGLFGLIAPGPVYAHDYVSTTVDGVGTFIASGNRYVAVTQQILPASEPESWYVDGSGSADFTTIQEAVTAAAVGDTIIVKNSSYTENVTVDKALTIRSENGASSTTVIAAVYDTAIFNVQAGGVVIDGFSVLGPTNTHVAGIELVDVNDCTIRNNDCSGCYNGIHLGGTATNNIVTGNCCHENSKRGISLRDTAHDNFISRNTVENNTEAGFCIKDQSRDNVLWLNNIIGNPVDILTENTYNSPVQVTYTYNDVMYTGYLGNYWENYAGIDSDGNGVGDTPHNFGDEKNDNYPLMVQWQGNIFIDPAVAPIAAFTATPTGGTAPLTVNFTDESTGTAPLTYAWDFENDGLVDSTEQNPSHEYSAAGTFSVKLTVTNAAGSDVELRTDYITAEEAPTMDVLHEGTVTLTPGETFEVTAYNSETVYTVNKTTPLGALQAAAAAGGFTYDVTDKNYSASGALLLDNVGAYLRDKDNRIYWYAYVNDVYKDGYNNPDGALNLIELADGDKVEFYYAADISDPTDLVAVKAAAIAAVKTVAATGVTPTDWTLQLSGAKETSVTKAYFEQGLACPSSGHQVFWTDEEENVWGGVPLWLFVAMIDDDPDVGSDHFNFNDDLAAQNYEVNVIAGDGWKATLDSADIARNDGYIVANTLNGEPLPLQTEGGKGCWPLHLKGSAVFGGQQVGNIVRIELSGLPEPPAGWTLEMIGDVGDTITQEEFEEGLACTGSNHYREWTDNESNVWSGVPLWVLLGAVDDIETGSHWTFNDTRATTGYSVNVIAGDNYTRTFTGADVARSDDYIVANKINGEPLSESGPLRLVGNGVAEEGALSGAAVGNIVKIEIPELQTPEAAPASWNLTLTGKISDVISQSEFEAGLACPNSGHLVEWTDNENNVWSGIPLWLLTGWVDDRQPHDYNANQAMVGYTVLVKAGDGYTKDFDSKDVYRSNDYIIANKLNDEPLDDSWPLRLVGDGVANEGVLSGKSVGNIVEIELTSFGTAPSIPEVRIVKYAEDGTTVLNEMTVNYLWLENESELDVIGDGTTIYRFEGITNNPEDLWDADETYPGGYKIANAVKGTRIRDLCELVGGMGAGTEIVLVAKDGYETRLPYSSIYTDPAVQARQGDAILAWWADGQYVPDYADGMRVLFTPDGDNVYGQWDMHETLPENYWHYYYGDGVMYPSCAGLAAKWITEIEIYSVPEGDWTLELDGRDIGGIEYDVSKTYFEQALACQFGANHKATYTDAQERVWEGMPLWFLVGFVDDDDQHSDNAFNDQLAENGYQVVITAADNTSVTINSADIIRSSDYIIANSLNGETIPETDSNWPLRLVGPAVTGGNSIKQIVKIELISSTSAAPPALNADITDNKVGQAIEITFTDDADWRGAITGIEVNGSDLSSEQYTVSEGNINIIADVFTAAGDYTIVVTATGYEDASVTQTMDASAGVVFTVDGEVSQTYTMADLKAMTATTGTYGSKTCTGVALNDLLTGLGITDGNWTVTVNAADGWETDPIPVSDIQEPTNNYLLTYAIDGSDIVVDGDSNLTPLRLYYGTAGNSVYKHVESITVSEPAGCEAVYTVTPVSDSAYTAGTTPSGIDTMTVNSGMTGFKYFAVNITPVIEHSGNEAVVFTLLRDSIQISINVTKADFDLVTTAQAGFNVQAGDVIKAYIVDDLTNAVDCNPVILQ